MPLEILPSESLIHVLAYLRSTDLSQVSAVNKALFQPFYISEAIAHQLVDAYSGYSLSILGPNFNVSSSHSNSRVTSAPEEGQSELYLPVHLYIVEIKSVLLALTSPQPLSGKGYWVSSSWIANSRKYYESLTIPEIASGSKSNKRGSVSKKQQKIRQRRGSDALPPWPAINAEITCQHGNMSLSRGAKGKRRILDNRSWKILRQFYCQGLEFKCPRTSECCECAAEEDAKALATMERRESLQQAVLSRYDTLDEILQGVYTRKSGVPSHLETRRVAPESSVNPWDDFTPSTVLRSRAGSFADSQAGTSPISEEGSLADYAAMFDLYQPLPAGAGLVAPLVPGLYVVLPRAWLKSWRQFIKDPNLSTLPPLDSTCLLCPTHNKLVVPPHLIEYLCGFRKHLLGGLGTYPGVKVELLSLDEWDLLHATLQSTLSEFIISFAYDGDGTQVQYNIETCEICHPIYYDPSRLSRNPNINRSNPQPIRYGL